MYTIGSEHSWSSFVRRPVRSEYLLKHGMTTSRSRRLRRNGKVVVGGGDQQPRRECWCHRVMQRCCLTPHCVMREASRRSRCKLLTGYWFSVQTSLLGYAARVFIAYFEWLDSASMGAEIQSKVAPCGDLRSAIAGI
jgi:hypothetical protein